MSRRKKLRFPSSQGKGGWLITLAVLSILATGTGGLFGLYLVSAVEKAIDEMKKSEDSKKAPALAYSGDLASKSLAPVVTNLANGDDTWVRLESSIIFSAGAIQNPDIVAAEIRQDILAYLRTLSVSQIQGASGLQHLREDLNERVSLRTKGLVREIVVETLVVQ
ncbi:flagellar basal body-associated FliL family protein [Microvirga thermotolerans]|uniref:Flagellar protein FliL n=1 Tax=Microvirga thermotolerans TaxID=2651334 RepID=A0A5P9K1W2_9HYPH|nr:flagellar basal body-associated FliL family protein [Microvirga thermotolerans]QFU17680.1 flagellar basal body protein FliL [Microvirga thermotolerans]